MTSSTSPGGSQKVAAALLEALVPIETSADPTVLRAYARDSHPLAIRASRGLSGLSGVPIVVVRPSDTDEVARVLRVAGAMSIPLVPYGGGSGIVGAALEDRPSIVLDTKRLAAVHDVDTVSMQVTVGAGILGGELERVLGGLGLTCGHIPQSLFSSTVGGWIAHRGAGQFSTKYGKIEELVVGLEVVLPDGTVLETRAVPASAAGPDLKRLFLGAEGTLGVVTRATLRVFPASDYRRHSSFAMEDMATGIDAARSILQRGYRPAVVRLYDELESRHVLSQPQHTGATLLVLDEGDPALVDLTLAAAEQEAAAFGGQPLGSNVGETWLRTRFSTAGLLRTIRRDTAVADALEVANDYRRLASTYMAMADAMRRASSLAVDVYGHCSHFYHTGGNLYMIFHAEAERPEDVSALYQRIVDAALDACVRTGGSLTHHHGVGRSKLPAFRSELGEPGLRLWESVRAAVDPARTMVGTGIARAALGSVG